MSAATILRCYPMGPGPAARSSLLRVPQRYARSNCRGFVPVARAELRIVIRSWETVRVDPKVIYWTCAFINMGLVVGSVLYGLAQLKAGKPSRHRAMMITATCLVLGFIVSYGLKLYFLGREDLSVWSNTAVWVLRFHETCVFSMVVGGGLGLRWGQQLRVTRSYSLDAADPVADAVIVRRHHRAGKVVITSAGLGFVSAGFVLAGMYSRMG